MLPPPGPVGSAAAAFAREAMVENVNFPLVVFTQLNFLRSGCKDIVAFDKAWYYLDGCKHILCSGCLLREQNRRGADTWLTCPTSRCGHPLSSGWYEAKIQHGRLKRDDDVRIIQPINRIARPDKTMDSFRYYRESDRAFRSKHTCYQVTYDDGGCSKTFAVYLPVERTIEWDDSQRQLVNALAMKLHTSLAFQDERDLIEVGSDGYDYPSEKAVMERAETDSGALRQFLHRLSRGKDLEDDLNKAADEADLPGIRATHIAADILRSSANHNNPSLLAQANGQILSVSSTGRGVMRYLKKLQLCTNREAIRLEESKRVNDKITTGWDMEEKMLELCIVHYDNVGFRIRGPHAGYDQFVELHVVCIPVHELMRVGIYSNDPAKQLSRMALPWADVKSQYKSKEKKSEFLIPAAEKEIFANRVLLSGSPQALQ